MKSSKNEAKNLIYLLLPAAGILFLLWYIRAAGADVIYSDYIRIVSQYLPDVDNLKKFFVPDILTRIPATFAARLINVRSFGYSVNFDRLLTVGGMVLISAVTASYARQKEVSPICFVLLCVVLFSLNKWEILLNGTAWTHVVSFGLFFINYYIVELVWTGEADARQEFAACIMPFLCLLFAGEYIASYAVIMLLIGFAGAVSGGAGRRHRDVEQGIFIRIMINTAAALFLYLLSRHFAVWEHSGATEQSLIEVLTSQPGFFVRLFIKSFAGSVIGMETIQSFIGGNPMPEGLVLLCGGFVILLYLAALVLYFTDEMFDRTVFPLILLLSGGLNHVLVCMQRWIFLRDSYAMSSRYTCQYMVGILGIILIFSLVGKNKRPGRRIRSGHKTAMRILACAGLVFITAGNCYTTYQEIRKAPYREANYEHMGEIMANYEAYDEADLMKELEWTKSPDLMYEALGILKENGLNVFSGSGNTR